MRLSATLVCAFACCSLLSGQTGGSSVEGQVVNSVTGAPVVRATVSVSLARGVPPRSGQPATVSSYTAETDAQGRFTFRNLSPGGYRMGARRQGFLEVSEYGSSSPDFFLGEDQRLTGAVARLTPHSVISGKVLDEFGDPVVGAPVYAFRWGYMDGVRRLNTANGGGSQLTTNDLGEYRIAGLPAGSYLIMAGAARTGAISYSAEAQAAAPTAVYTNTYYPAATVPDAATEVKTPTGASVPNIDIKLAKVNCVTIRGRVTGFAVSAQSGGYVSLMPRSGPLMGTVGRSSLLPDGSFQITGVPAGSYRLAVQQGNQQGRATAGGAMSIEVGNRDLDGIVLPAFPAVDVNAVIKSDPPGQCFASFASLQSESGSSYSPAGGIRSESPIIFTNVIPATYSLRLSVSGCQAQSVRFAGREVAQSKITIDSAGPLEITMRRFDTAIAGAVTHPGGKPADSGTVVAAPKDGSTPILTLVGAQGSFGMAGLKPGEYELFAFERVNSSSAQSPEYLKAFSAQARNVTVAGRETVQLTMIPASATGETAPQPLLQRTPGTLEGRVVNAANGAPLPGATVHLGTQPFMRAQNQMAGVLGVTVSRAGEPRIGAPPANTGINAETDDQGRFVFRNIQPDIYYISAEKEGFSLSAAPGTRLDAVVMGNAQQMTGHSLRLVPQSVVAGRVTDEYGEAVSNAIATLFGVQSVAGAQRLNRTSTARTDDLGKFRMADVPPGPYYIAITKPPVRPGRPGSAAEPETGLGIAWHPRAPDSSGSPLLVAGGKEVPVEIVTRRTRLVRLRGTVLDETGAPASRFSIALSPRGLGSGVQLGGVTLMQGGAFEVSGVPPGSYLLRATTPAQSGQQAASRTAYSQLEVRDSGIDGIQLRLGTGKEVRGSVRVEGAASPSAALSAYSDEGFTASASSQSGAFSLRPVWPLSYRLEVTGICRSCYVKTIRYGGREAPDAKVDFSVDGELEIVVSDGAASVNGVAVDRQQRLVPDASVIIAPADGSGRILTGKADARGAFYFGALRPGAYRIYAWDGEAPQPTPDALAPFESRATVAQLPANASPTLQVIAQK